MRNALRIIGATFLLAAFLWGFYLTQQWLAMENFKNGVAAGMNLCDNKETIEPQGDIRAYYLAEQTNPDYK